MKCWEVLMVECCDVMWLWCCDVWGGEWNVCGFWNGFGRGWGGEGEGVGEDLGWWRGDVVVRGFRRERGFGEEENLFGVVCVVLWGMVVEEFYDLWLCVIEYDDGGVLE